jgi:hypothetical protein
MSYESKMLEQFPYHGKWKPRTLFLIASKGGMTFSMESHFADFIIGRLMLVGSLCWTITKLKPHHKLVVCRWTVERLRDMTFSKLSQKRV